MNNKLLDIQEVLFNQIKRLDNNEKDIEEIKTEIARANALSNNAITFIKTINTNLRIKELSKKYQITEEKLNKELGL